MKMRMTNPLRGRLLAAAAWSLVAIATPSLAQPVQSPDARAETTLGKMTQDEKLQLVFAYFASDWQGK